MTIALLAALLLGDAAERVVRAYSTGSLRVGHSTSTPRYGSFVTRADRDSISARPFLEGVDAGAALGADTIRTVLQTALGEDDSPLVDIVGDRVVVAATESQHRIVAAALRDLDAALGRPIAVDVAVYALPAQPGTAGPPALVAPADVAKVEAALAGAGKLLWSGTVDVPVGKLSSASSVRQVPFLADYDAEVAKKAKIATPVEWTMTAGVQAAIDATLAREGAAVHLTALVSVADVLGLERYDTRARDVGAVELAKVAGTRLASTATLPFGAALVLRGSSADAGETAVLLRPRGSPRSLRLGASAGARPLALLPVSLITATSGRSLPLLNADLEESATEEVDGAANIVTLMGSDLAAQMEQPGGTGKLLISGDEKAVEAALARARALEAMESATVELRVAVVRAPDGAAALDPKAPAVASAQLAASVRRSAGAIVGREETAVSGYTVEIAEEAIIADPQVRSLFRGAIVSARVLEATNAGALVEVSVISCDFGPRERRFSEATDVGDHERIPRRVGSLRRTVEAASSAPVLLGDLGPDGDGHLYAVLTARTGA
jgi:hypothetical protein